MFSIETKTWKCYHTLWKTFFLQTLYCLHSTIWSWVTKSSLHSRGERHAPPSGAWSPHIFGIKISLFSLPFAVLENVFYLIYGHPRNVLSFACFWNFPVHEHYSQYFTIKDQRCSQHLWYARATFFRKYT